MTTTDTANATTQPKPNAQSSCAENAKPNLIRLIRLQPNRPGTARKNVNSAAATRDTPIKSAPIMVAPEREVPGIIAST